MLANFSLRKTSQTPMMQQASRRARWLGSLGYVSWVVAMFVMAQVVVVGVLWALLRIGVPLMSLNETTLSFIQIVGVFGVALVLTIGLPWWIRRSKTTLSELGLTRLLSWSDIGLGLLAVVPYMILSAILLGIASTIPGFVIDQAQDVGFRQVVGVPSLLMAFACLVVLAPVVEETLFRGYLYGKLRSRLRLPVAMLAVSLCFAVLHLQLNVGIDVFALSIVLCVLREVTGSIWAGVLLHMTKNAIAFYVLFVAQMIH